MSTRARDPLVPPEPDAPITAARIGDAPASGIPGFHGPFEVGRYAHALREQLRGFARVALIGEVAGAKFAGANLYFELRDRDGALPCAMWRNDFDKSGVPAEHLRDGAQLVAAGGCDFYPGSATSSPSFRFRVTGLRLAGEGDLLAQLERLRRQLASERLFELQKRLRLPALPRTIGVVTAQGSAARRDFLAGLARRGWSGRIVWGYAPVQDRRAAGAITRAIADLALLDDVETIVVTRGGGSIVDLWSFCDEALCRTVALLAKPVISAVGHETDRTLIDDVAALACSTPTHAAEAAVRIDCVVARQALLRDAVRVDAAGRGAVVARGRHLATLSRAPRDHVARHRRELHQKARELRASSRRGVGGRIDRLTRIAATILPRKLTAAVAAAARSRHRLGEEAAALNRAAGRARTARRDALDRMLAALNAHDPQRTLERGYALALDEQGKPLPTAAAVRTAGNFDLWMADDTLPARIAAAPDDAPAARPTLLPDSDPDGD